MDAITSAYRSGSLKIRAATYDDMLSIWPAFDPASPEAYRAWFAGATSIIARDRARAEQLARQYLTAHALSHGTTVTAARAEPLAAEQLATSLRVTSLVAFAKARRAGRTTATALRIASVASSGSAARLVLNGGRSVIQQTAQAGQIRGWVRVGNPQCDLCKTILGRFYPAATTDFKCHDHCACAFEPVYR